MRKFLMVTSAIASLSVSSMALSHDGHKHGPAAVPTAAAAAAEAAATPSIDSSITAAVTAPHRTPANVARDIYRNPAETLAFFGVSASDTVVELQPGGGWYTEILAPMMKDKGTLYVAGPWARFTGLQQKAKDQPDLYGGLKFAGFPAEDAQPSVPAASADVVLTFRNVHNWRFGAANDASKAFEDIYAMLKPGGVLGVVEHRLNEDADPALEKSSGYMKESSVIAFALAAGFKLDARSEVNANPRDTKDHPKGVWTLPPSLSLKDVDREKYVAIGESDRMTLRFVKPAQ